MSAQFASADVSPLISQATALQRKRDVAAQKCSRVAQNVVGVLQTMTEESAGEQRQWVSGAREKLLWCEEPANDKYSVEAKLETLQQLLESVEEGWKLTESLTHKLQSLRVVTSQQRHDAIAKGKEEAEEAMKTLVKQLSDAK